MNKRNKLFGKKVDANRCPIDQSNSLCDSISSLSKKHAVEIETLLSIQQAITSHLDLSDVLQMVADEARKLTSAKLSFVYVLEDDALSLAAVSGSDHPGQMIGYRVPVAQSVAGKSIQTGQPMMLTDIHEDDPRLYSGSKLIFGTIGCYIAVPLIYGDRSIGVIAVADQCSSVLGDDSLRVLTMLAPSAVIGIENARLYQEQQERRLEAEGRHQMSESMRVMLAILNSNRSLPDIMQYIVSHVSSRLFDCQATAIFALQPKDNTLVIQAAHGLQDKIVEAQLLPGYDVAAQVVRTGQPVTVSNAQIGGITGETDLESTPEEWAMVSQLIVIYHAWMAVPLIVKGEVYGAILMYYNEPRVFSKEEINLAQMFSDQVALAIENARLRIQAEQSAVNAERNRLARELHDAVNQTLFSTNLIAEVLPRLWEKDPEEAQARLLELRQLTRGALAEMRTLLFELRPAVFKEAKIGYLLKHLIESVSVRSRIPVSLTVEGDRILPPEVQTALYRITQEALNNVVKHANCSQTSVVVKCLQDAVELSICDDGCGFDPNDVALEHFGLSIMQERANSIKATMQVVSQAGCGTMIKVLWVDPDAKEQR